MKTGDEQFDDLIRKKLDGSEVQPPSNLFHQIVPEEKKRRGFFWLWLAGIGVIITTALMVHQQTNSHRKGNSDSKSTDSFSTMKDHSQSVLSANENHENVATESSLSDKASSGNVESHEAGNTNILTAQNSSGTMSAGSASYHDADITASITPGKSKKKNNGNAKNDANGQYSNYNNINYDQLYVPSTGLSSNVNLIHPLHYIPQDDRPIRKVETTKKQITDFNNHLPGKWALEAGGGLIFSKEHISTSSTDTATVRLINQMKGDLESSTGWQLHAGVIRQLNQHFSISVTAGFSQIRNSSTTRFTEYYNITEYDTITYPILFPFNPPVIYTDVDSTVISKSTVHIIDHRPVFTTVTLGSSLHYTIPVNNFIFEPHAGISFRVLQSVKGESALNPEFTSRDAEANYNTTLSPALTAGLNFGYLVSEKVSAFFQPSYEYVIGNRTKNETSYQSKFSNIKMGIGIRYTFFRKEATEITPMLSDK